MLVNFVLEIGRTYLFQLESLYRNSWIEEILIRVFIPVLAFLAEERDYQVYELRVLLLCLLVLLQQLYSGVFSFLGKHAYLWEGNSDVFWL